jgi:hypothetical protein
MQQPTDKETKEQWRTNPDNWKWGIFYYNKEDKRLLPPKIFKAMGWTINWANPYSILFMLVLIAVIGVIGFLTKHYLMSNH